MEVDPILTRLTSADVTLLHRIRKYDFLTAIDATLGPTGSVALSFKVGWLRRLYALAAIRSRSE